MTTRRVRSLRLVAVSVTAFVLFGSAVWFAAHMKKPGHVNRTPLAGLHPRLEAPFSQRHRMGLYGDPGSEFGFEVSEVDFSAVEGTTSRGWLAPALPADGTAAVAVHGGEGDRRTIMRQLPMLHRAGDSVLLFSYR